VTRGDRLVRAEGWPPHPERFDRTGSDVTELLAPQPSGRDEIGL
jgi:pilus assembly protein CpaF